MIKKHRQLKNMTQKELSNQCNLSQSYISNLEERNYTFSPTISMIIKISMVLDIPPIELALWFIETELKN